MTHEHTVGDVVFVLEFRGKPSRRTTVTEVKNYKRGPKVTCKDGSVWDVDGSCMWGHRGSRYYTGPHLEPHSDEQAAAFAAVQTHSRLRWADKHFEELTVDEQTALGIMLGKIKRAHRE